MNKTVISFGLSSLVFLGCAPADVSGDYVVTVTSGSNACGLDGWTESDSAEVRMEIVQADADANATVTGLGGTVLNLWLGDNRFAGDVAGSSVQMTLIGTRSHSNGDCDFTINAELDATVDEQIIEGMIRYRPVTDGATSCGTLADCENTQTFVGTRPPVD